MPKNKSAKYRRKFYSLYLDTIALLVLSLLLVMIVWLSMRSMPVLEAIQAQKSNSSSSKEESAAHTPKFVVKYVQSQSLTSANSPELIAFGDNAKDATELNDIRILGEYGIDSDLVPPRLPIKEPKFDNSQDFSADSLLSLQKPKITVRAALNTQSTGNLNVSTNVTITSANVYWTLPKAIEDVGMPNIEQLMRKYGWLFGSLDVVLVVGDEGYVSNVIICSDDVVDAKLLREFKGKLLSLHLGKQNANTSIPIGVSWNLP